LIEMVSLPKWAGTLIDIVGVIIGILLLVCSFYAFYMGGQNWSNRDAFELVLNAFQLMIFSFFIVLGHFRYPRCCLEKVAFLGSFFGRGIVLLWVGFSVVWVGARYGKYAIVVGSLALGAAVVDLFISCPCLKITLDAEGQLKDKRDRLRVLELEVENLRLDITNLESRKQLYEKRKRDGSSGMVDTF